MSFKKVPSATFFLVACCLFLLTGCNKTGEKKIFYINSYHNGYPSSDDIRDGMMETLDGEEVTLEIFYMDTKLHPEKEQVGATVKEVLQKMEDFAPDLVIASDDNAVGLVVKLYLNGKEVPVVFCGVNWSAEQYGLGENVTGMLEVLPLRECIQTIKDQNPDIRRISVLSENSQSERNNTRLLDTLYQNLGMKVEYHLVDDFEQWKAAFKEVSFSSDLIYLPTNGAIRNWNHDEAVAFVEQNLHVPTITCDDFMMDYCVFGLTKVAKEQGVWAAKTALRILNGSSPSEIPISRNSQFHAYLNQSLAHILEFNLLEEPKGMTVIE
jgi:ABC-type uncharacterized transport system substrate-binding protein